MINLVCASMAQIPKDIHTTLESIGDHFVGEIGFEGKRRLGLFVDHKLHCPKETTAANISYQGKRTNLATEQSFQPFSQSHDLLQ